jgi:hypothetical protein
MVAATGVFALADPGVPVPYASLRSLVSSLGIQTRMPWREAKYRLRLIEDDLVGWTLARVAEISRAHGAVPAFLALDNVTEPPEEPMRALGDAGPAGLLVFDLLDVWQGHAADPLYIAPWDTHPNASGSRIIARRLLELMRRQRSELGLEDRLS